MCNESCIEWGKRNITQVEVGGKRILEVGSYNVNGSLRSIVEAFEPAEYMGTDIRLGPGVDMLCPAEHLVERFGNDSFDMVISTCTLEHIRDWRTSVSGIKKVCKPGGLILIIVPSCFPLHDYPHDFWRYELEDVTRIFTDCEILILEEDPQPPSLVYTKIRKPSAFVENDLAGCELYSVIVGERLAELRWRDYFNVHYALLRARYFYKYVYSRLYMVYVKIATGINLHCTGKDPHVG
jgi:SAM-dependent methyltransferase